MSMVAVRFHLGQVVATVGVLNALNESNQTCTEFLHRHATGDWGDLDAEDKQTNERAILHGERLLSAYLTKNGSKIWIISEADRSSTTLLLPDEY